MADNLPDGNPAANGQQPTAPATPPAAPSQPATPPADANQQPQTPAPLIQFDSLDADQKKYLAGQGITSQEQLTSENLLKVVNHARSSQQTAAERQTELDRIRGTINPQPQPANPFAPAATQQPSTTPNQPATPQTPEAGQPQAPAGPDQLQMYLLASQLGTQFPELVEDLTTGKFYQDMQGMGIPLTVSGQVNIAGITQFGKTMQTQKQYEAKIAELNKPNENNQAPAVPQTPTPPANDAPMTKQIAQAILLQDPNHARAKEAQEFLNKQV